MLIIRRLNCIDAGSGIVTLKISEWSKITCRIKQLTPAYFNIKVNCNLKPLICFQGDDTRCYINTIQPPDDEHIMLETCRGS